MSKKDKLLASAQKNLTARQFAKAIKDYEKLVELEPKDTRHRQKLAELYVRTGDDAGAVEQYEVIAKYYHENDFHLKAIAIYKQIQKLDPSHIQTYHRLAELNEKQGLIGNAVSELKGLVGFYEKQGKIDEVVQTLKKMATLDPSNLNARAKLVEICAHHGMEEQAVDEFQKLIQALQDKGAFDKILKLYEMFVPILPDAPAMQRGLVGILIEKGDFDKGIRLVQDMLKREPSDAGLLQLLARGYSRQGDFRSARLTFQQLVKLKPKDLDLRADYVRACLHDKEYMLALQELEEWKDSFMQAERLTEIKGFYEEIRSVLPDDRRVLQTLDSIYALTGEGDKLLDIMAPDAIGGAAGEDDTADGFSDDDFLPSVEEDAVADLVDTEKAEDLFGDLTDEGSAEEEIFELEADAEAEMEADAATEEISFDDVVEAGEASAPPAEDDFFDLELEIEDDTDEVVSLDADEPQETITLEEPSASEVIHLDFVEAENEASAAPADMPSIQDRLEEVDFFLQQGMASEAEQACLALAQDFPDDARVMEKLQAARTALKAKTAQAETKTAPTPAKPKAQPADKESSSAGLLSTADFQDLMNELETEEEPPSESGVRLGQQLDKADVESHYNLGIAYREMGLIDDAIAEFRKIKDQPSRWVDGHTLLGLCLRDQQSFGDAESVFKEALEKPDLSNEARFNLHYELGLLFEMTDQPMEALDSFQYVADFDATFRDVKNRIVALRQKLGLKEGKDGGRSGGNRVSYL